MTTEKLATRAALHAALGDPTRLAIVDALGPGDESPGVLAARLGIGTNLMAHHVATLESVGLVSRTRSEADRRRSYLHLDRGLLAGLLPDARLVAGRVVFVCTRNSARSQLAAALWSRGSTVPVASAGTHPAHRIHPRAVATASRHALALRGTRPQNVHAVLAERDLVVTVCDSAHEELEPALAQRPSPTLHWSIPDPAAHDTDEAFEAAYGAVEARVSALWPVVQASTTD